ncbi:hypothetical protein GALMADRAFT_727609 [Galerina marginata CBS 339.88]|uniref:Uncharacterized protein n=1 Tax=Galerina marginata (strain CBS 339.88) TaxID=685588 RepID=A0A067SQT6_GALM3|nr:hypothetical protein GALMADRAFT_727609 [Galerina marginata CBS 339.88]
MLIVLVISYLLQGFIAADAVPLSGTLLFPRQTNIAPSSQQECVCPSMRSKWDIVWSCFVTIFICSWVSVHPNIPRPGDGRWRKALRRLELMSFTIFSPELIIFWASKQWLAARYFAKCYSKDGWTMVHGYFIQMGGFVLYDGDKAVGLLGPEELKELVGKKRITVPTITEEEIRDKSKGDGLSKTVIIIQTTWFIAQCAARSVRGLIVTEMELVTLALATVDVLVYAFWWNCARLCLLVE